MNNRAARYVNIALGFWLFVTAFLWPHGSSQFVNTWLMGLIVAITAAGAIRVPGLRYVSTAAGVWLIVSLFAGPTVSSPATAWHNVFVGAAIALVSLVGPDESDITSSNGIQSTS